MSTLNQAVQIAASAHEGQDDIAGQPYILHPLRVMMSLETEEERIVGILHDVLEDTVGRRIKLADLKDNMDWNRINNPTEDDMKRMQKYQKAYYVSISQ